MPEPRHHQHIRKRIHVRHEPYPHPDRAKRTMDTMVYVGGLVLPIMTIPQLVELYANQDGSGLSLLTWGTYLVGSCFWFAYGVVHKERPIMVINASMAVVQTLIVVGIVLYS